MKQGRRQQALAYISSDTSEQASQQGTSITRRAALRLLLGAGAVAGAAGALPAPAWAANHDAVDAAQAELDEAQARYDEVEKELDRLGEEYEALAREQAETLDQIEQVQADIAEVQAAIDAKQAEIAQTEQEIQDLQDEIDAKKAALATRMSDAYKAGNRGVIEAVFSSRSLEELVSNIHYLDRINEADAEMIASIEEAKAALDEAKAKLEEQEAELEAQKAELEEHKAALQELSDQQAEQLSAMQEKQAEVQATLDGLSDEVRALMEKRDAEVLAYNLAEQAEREEAARAAAAAGIPLGGGELEASTGSQKAVVAACARTGSPGAGYCAMWVSLVFRNAGYRYIGGNANDMYNRYCYSSNKDELKVGMIIAVSTHSHTAAGRIWGHVGIYIGNGLVMENIGYIKTTNLDRWISYYGTTVIPRWGWAGNIVLS